MVIEEETEESQVEDSQTLNETQMVSIQEEETEDVSNKDNSQFVEVPNE